VSHVVSYNSFRPPMNALSLQFDIEYFPKVTYVFHHARQSASLAVSRRRHASDELEHYTPTRTLRSSDTNLLCVPRARTCFGSRGFSVAAPTIWNLSLLISAIVVQ